LITQSTYLEPIEYNADIEPRTLVSSNGKGLANNSRPIMVKYTRNKFHLSKISSLNYLKAILARMRNPDLQILLG